MFISASEVVFPNVSVFLEEHNKVYCVSKEIDECSGRQKKIYNVPFGGKYIYFHADPICILTLGTQICIEEIFD